MPELGLVYNMLTDAHHLYSKSYCIRQQENYGLQLQLSEVMGPDAMILVF